jgi:hypothetical protein
MSLRAPLVGFAAVVVLGSAVACGGNRAAGTPPPSSPEGTWTFEASVPLTGGALFVEGWFTAVQDTVLLTVEGAYCLPTDGNLEMFRYRCPALFTGSRAQQTITTTSFSFPRRRPAERARVSVSYTNSTTRRVCAQYTTDSGGNRVCARWTTEAVEVPGSQSAILKVTPIR